MIILFALTTTACNVSLIGMPAAKITRGTVVTPASSIVSSIAGVLDTAFATMGIAKVDVASGTEDRLWGMDIDANEKILMSGISVNADRDSLVLRFNADGSLDTSFGTGGKVVINFAPGYDDSARAVRVIRTGTHAGKILISGYVTTPTSDEDWYVARLNSNGTLDTSFGTAGKTVVDVNAAWGEPKDLIFDSFGKITVVGYTNINGVGDGGWAIWRLNADGTSDTTFNTVGWQAYNSGTDNSSDASFIRQQSSGKYIVCGFTQITGVIKPFVTRLTSAGAIDTTFGTSGYAVVPSPGYCSGLKVLDDDSIINSGELTIAADNLGYVAKLTANGAPDTSFGTSGVTTLMLASSTTNHLGPMVVTGDGKILLPGYHTVSGQYVATLNRFSSSGNIDASFGTGGTMTFTPNATGTNFATQTAIGSTAVYVGGYYMGVASASYDAWLAKVE